jgi:hypothetical protein
MRKQSDLLNDVADATLQPHGVPAASGPAIDQHIAGAGEEQAIHHFERGGFAGTAAAEQDQRASFADLKVQPLEHIAVADVGKAQHQLKGVRRQESEFRIKHPKQHSDF